MTASARFDIHLGQTEQHSDGLPRPAINSPTPFPEKYRSRLTTVERALEAIESGHRVYIGGGCGEPLELAQALVNRAPKLHNVEIIHVLTAGHAAYAAPELSDSFHVNSLFIGANVRHAVQAGSADFTPVFLHEIPKLFREGYDQQAISRKTGALSGCGGCEWDIEQFLKELGEQPGDGR